MLRAIASGASRLASSRFWAAGKPGRLSAGLLLGVTAVVLGATLAACASPANPYYDPSKRHHRPDGFTNNYGPAGGKPFSELLRWWRERWTAGLPKPPSTHVAGYAGFPVVRPDLAVLRDNRTRTTVTWIGHATLLVQVGGLNILTDPQFSERAFMVQWAGPRRRVPLPATLAELPRIDVVLISHSHYDHLDSDTVLALNRQPGGAPLFMVPLGIERWMREHGVERVERFDWWEQAGVPGAPGVEVHFVPAQHWSARSPFDRNRTLWGGWVVKAPRFSFYYTGDTGYSKDFVDIGERFGGFDLAAIPVGAYEPRWFMQSQHVNPAEAVQIHRDVRAKRSIGVHWGTFELTDESLDEPIGALADALRAAAVPADTFQLYRHGETRVLD